MSPTLEPSPQPPPSPMPSPQRRGTFSLRSSSSSVSSKSGDKSPGEGSSSRGKLARMFSLSSNSGGGESRWMGKRRRTSGSTRRSSSGEKDGEQEKGDYASSEGSAYSSEALSRTGSLTASGILGRTNGGGKIRVSFDDAGFRQRAAETATIPDMQEVVDPETPTTSKQQRFPPHSQNTSTTHPSDDSPSSSPAHDRTHSTSTTSSTARRQVGVVGLPTGEVNLISPKGSEFPVQSHHRRGSEPVRRRNGSLSLVPSGDSLRGRNVPVQIDEDLFKSTPILPEPSPMLTPSKLERPGFFRTRSKSAPSPVTPGAILKEYFEAIPSGGNSPAARTEAVIKETVGTASEQEGKGKEHVRSDTVESEASVYADEEPTAHHPLREATDTLGSVYDEESPMGGEYDGGAIHYQETLKTEPEEMTRKGTVDSESSVYPDEGMDVQRRDTTDSQGSVYEDESPLKKSPGSDGSHYEDEEVEGLASGMLKQGSRQRDEKRESEYTDLGESLMRNTEMLKQLEGPSDFKPRHGREATQMFTDESSIQVQSPIQSPTAEVASLASDPDRQTTSGSEMMDELEGMIADAIDAQGNVVETPPSGKTKGRPSSFHEATPTRPKILTEIKNDLPAIPGMIRTTTSPSMASTPSPTKMEPREGRRHSMMAFSTPTGKENFSARTRKTTLLLGLNRPYPAAMDYSDIKTMRTPNERAIAYAKKINELAKEDSGLHIWLSCIKEQQYGSGFRSPSNSTHGGTNAKLHTRDFSGASEFPTRPDAYKAKELTRSPLAQSQPLTVSQRVLQPPVRTPTSIPYPGAVPKRHGGTGSISTPNTLSRASGPKSSTSGFFSTLGRKTSRSVRSPTAALASRSAAPIGTVSAPTLNLGTIKGGPRMPYNGSTTLSSFSEAEDRISSPISETPHATIRQSMLTARPTISSTKSSFVYGSGKTEDGLSDKLDKLADILPQANRDVLKDYLIRANGDDLLVVGQYLDDERSGRV